MEIRKAEAGDYEAFCRILLEIDALHGRHEPDYFRATVAPSRTRDFFDVWLSDKDKALFIATEGLEVTGFAQIEKRAVPDLGFLIGNDHGHFATIIVARQWQRKGIGRALVAAAEAWAKAQGFKELRLTVWDFNSAAKSFYRSLGFRPAIQTLIKRFP